MGTLYRIANKTTGEPIGDFIIDSADAVLLSSTHELLTTENLAQTLDDLKFFYIDEINKKTSQVRSRFITLELGQSITYTDKAQEALEYMQATNPVDTDYRYLDFEATATDKTVAFLAVEILQKAQDLRMINPTIEAQRKRGIKQVNEAENEFEAKTARDFAFSSLDAHGV